MLDHRQKYALEMAVFELVNPSTRPEKNKPILWRIDMLTTSMKAIRQALRDQFGKRHYKITKTGDVHVYGPMPNSRIVGWWLMGDLITAELWLGLPANNSNKD